MYAGNVGEGRYIMQVSPTGVRLLDGGNSQLQTKYGPEVIKKFSSSTQLSMKFFLPINVKMPTCWHLNIY